MRHRPATPEADNVAVGNATGTTAKDSNSEANSIHVLMTLRHERVITVTGISVKPNQGTTILLPPIPTPHPPPKPIGLSPTISSVIPAVAASGDGITITGTGFGTEQGSSYVLFSDGGVNWGAPGDLANFQIDGWTDTANSVYGARTERTTRRVGRQSRKHGDRSRSDPRSYTKHGPAK